MIYVPDIGNSIFTPEKRDYTRTITLVKFSVSYQKDVNKTLLSDVIVKTMSNMWGWRVESTNIEYRVV